MTLFALPTREAGALHGRVVLISGAQGGLGSAAAQACTRAGATVVKVESPSRPDGTRTGDVRFFDWMNSGKLSCAMDFDRDRVDLEALLAGADVVLEGARPAALARRGLGPSRPGRPGRVWLRLSGYAGADGRPAFGASRT